MTPAEVDGGEIAIFRTVMTCISVGKSAEECIGQQAGDLHLGHRYGVAAALPQQRDALRTHAQHTNKRTA